MSKMPLTTTGAISVIALALSAAALTLLVAGGRGTLEIDTLRIGDPSSGTTYEVSVGPQGGIQVVASGSDGSTLVCLRPVGRGRVDMLVNGKPVAAVGVSGENADEVLVAVTGSILVDKPRSTLNTIVWPGEVRVIGGLGRSRSLAIEGVSEGEFEEED